MRPILGIRPMVVGIALLGPLLGTLLVAGCSLPRRYYAVEAESIRDLAVLNRQVKRIGVARFENRSTAPASAIVTDFQTSLSAALERNCGKAELIDSHATAAPDFLRQAPLLTNGRIDTYAIAQTARKDGFQVIVAGQLVSLGHRVDHSGRSSMRKTHHRLDLRLHAVALDALTGVSLGQDSRLLTLPIDGPTGAAIDAGASVDLPELTEAVDQAGVDMALKLCTPIRAHHWQTVVSETQGTEMRLAAHPTAGLKPGDRLAVFDGSRTVDGSGGERFVLSGFRLGTVSVKSVTDNAVVAAGEDGETFPVGSILVPVR